MKKIFTLALFFYFIIPFCKGQYLWSNFKHDLCPIQTRSMATDASGNIYTVGSFIDHFDVDPGPGTTTLTSAGVFDVYLIKYDANGNLAWAKSFGGTFNDYVSSIVLDAAGNIYVSGLYRGTVDFDPGAGVETQIADGGNSTSSTNDGFISKFNNTGDFQWVRTIGAAAAASDQTAEEITALAVDNSGNIYALGAYKSAPVDIDPGAGISIVTATGTAAANAFIVKLDQNGDYLNGFGLNFGNSSASPVSLKIKNGALYSCFKSLAPDFSLPPVVNKYDLNLMLTWSKIIGSVGFTPAAIDIDALENINIGGTLGGYSDFDPGPATHSISVPNGNGYDIVISQLNNNGEFQWVKRIGGVGSLDWIYNIVSNPLNREIYIVGSVNGSVEFDGANQSGYFVPTFTSSGYVGRFDGGGNFISVQQFESATGTATPSGVLFDQLGNIIIGGKLAGEADFDPNPQTTAILTSVNTFTPGTFLCKWGIRDVVNYYNTKANLGLENLATWSSTADGTGASPQNFTDSYQHYNVVSQANANFSGVFSISGIESKLIIGDGISAVSLSVPAGAGYIDSLTKVDVSGNASLVLQNNIFPTLNQLATGSTVEFAQTGVSTSDTIKIPVTRYYNLKLTGGLRNFLNGITTVGGDFTADAVINITGTMPVPYSSSNVPYLNCLGNVTFLNGTSFEPETIAAAQHRFGLRMNGPGPVQTLTSNGTDLRLISLIRDSTSVCDLVVSPGTNITLGAAWGGGLSLKSPNATLSTTGGTIRIIFRSPLSDQFDQGKINSNGTSFDIHHGTSQPNYYFQQNVMGTLRFTPGSTINNFTMASEVSPFSNYAPDKLHFATDATLTGVLSLQSGYIDIVQGNTLNLTSSATLAAAPDGGSHGSFVQGSVRRTGTTAFTFPVGQITDLGFNNFTVKYAPVDFSNYTGNDTYTVYYKKENYPIHTIDPVTLAANPLYAISGHEYWNITPAATGGTVNIEFHYNDNASQILDPGALEVAHFDGTDWNNLGGLPDPSNTTDVGSALVFNVTDFSPFTFGGTADVVVPVKLNSFTVKKQTGSVLINWITEQEINSKSFIVERSSDQNKWDAIANVAAAGNSSEKINYGTTDIHPAKGINYYRMKQVDVDGRFTYSEIRSVYFGSDANVVIAPNPAKEKITVYLPGNTSFISINIYDMNGRLVKSIASNEETAQVNLSNVSKGIYTVKITGKNINEVRKLVVD